MPWTKVLTALTAKMLRARLDEIFVFGRTEVSAARPGAPAFVARRRRTTGIVASLIWWALVAGAQAPGLPSPPAPVNAVRPFTVVIDAAHGGTDTGAHLSEQLEEKDLVLALSVQLRSTLSAHGIQVTTTREMDVNLSPLRRAEVANHRAAAACILLHATASGHGVHLFTSSLPPVSQTKFLPWDTAQAAFVQASLRLSSEINSALTHAEIPVTLGRTFLLPMDNLACPAVAIEVAPLGHALGKPDGAPTPVTDVGYQKEIISALAAAIEEWKQDVAEGAMSHQQ